MNWEKIFALFGVVIIILSILFAAWLIYFLATFNKGSYPPELIDFKPTEFEYKIEGNFYYSIGDDHYFSSSGVIDPDSQYVFSADMPKDKCYTIEVAPDASHIAYIDEQNCLNIRNYSGELLYHQHGFTVCSILDSNFSGKYMGSTIRWSADSRYLYFVKYKEAELSYHMELKKYSIVNNEVTQEITIPASYTDCFYLSPDSKFFFIKLRDDEKGEDGLFKYSLETGRCTEKYFRTTACNIALNPAEILTTYSPGMFSDNAYNKNIVIKQEYIGDDTYCLIADSCHNKKRIFEFKLGYQSFKNFHYGFHAIKYFLPGDRYFIFCVDNDIKEPKYAGSYLVDSQTGQYMKIQDNIRFHFFIKSKRGFKLKQELWPITRSRFTDERLQDPWFKHNTMKKEKNPKDSFQLWYTALH